jgi:hypothetical protein
VDRRLLTIATIAFLIELLLFLADIGELPISIFSSSEGGGQRTVIGQIETARQNVRRRGFDSSIWEDSEARDRLFEYDSVLTLSESAANLKLGGDIKIDLQENTLVVLEPIEDSDERSFRLRFTRGDLRSRSQNGQVQLVSGDWSITALSGSDMQLRSGENNAVEVNVKSGQVQVENAKLGAVQLITADQRLTLEEKKLGALLTASGDFSWSGRLEQKVYAHHFPVAVDLLWHGQPESLEIASGGIKKTIELGHETPSLNVALKLGTHHLTLRQNDRISKSLMLEVIRAPKIIHLIPLPRDRVRQGDPVNFAWLAEGSIHHFQVELANDADFHEVLQAAPADTSRTTVNLSPSGMLFWRIIGFDKDNFMIPAGHSYMLISHPDPFAPPEIRAPSSQQPDESSNSRQLPLWYRLINLILPQAHGETALPPVILNWNSIQGADYYVIEISTTADFQNPEVIARSSTNSYAWTNFERRSYYYRVAAGSHSGRAGLFSTALKIDLTIWPPPSQKKKSLPKPPEVAPEIKPEILPPPKAPTTIEVPTPSEPTEEVPVTDPVHPGGEFSFYWRPLWQNITTQAPDKVRADFTGGTLAGVGVDFERERNGQWWRGHFELALIRWKAESATEWPFQKTLTAMPWSVSAFSGQERGGLAIGSHIGQSYSPKRKDFEQIEFAPVFYLGPIVEWTVINSKSLHRHSLGAELSARELGVRSKNLWRRSWGEHGFYGGEFNLGLATGANRSRGQIEVGLQLGWLW